MRRKRALNGRCFSFVFTLWGLAVPQLGHGLGVRALFLSGARINDWQKKGGTEMKYSVSDDVLRATTRCWFDFSCLKDGTCGQNKACVIEMMVGSNVLLLKRGKQVTCAYKASYGYNLVCTCPTRYTIYRQYEDERG